MINKLGNGEEVGEKQKYGTMLRRYFNYFDPQKAQAFAERYNLEFNEHYVKPEGGHQFLVSFLCRR